MGKADRQTDKHKERPCFYSSTNLEKGHKQNGAPSEMDQVGKGLPSRWGTRLMYTKQLLGVLSEDSLVTGEKILFLFLPY